MLPQLDTSNLVILIQIPPYIHAEKVVMSTSEFRSSPTRSLKKQQTISTILKNLEMEALVLSTMVGDYTIDWNTKLLFHLVL